MIHARLVAPRIFPWNSERAPEQIDRAQDIGGDLTLGKTKQNEIGRTGALGYKKENQTLSYSMRQFENGAMKLYRALANLADPVSAGLDNSVTLEDLSSTKFEIAAYMTDDSNVFTGTAWFPKLRVNGFTLNIGDPDAIVERSFDLVGEDLKILDGNYFSYVTETVTGIPSGFDEFTTAVLSPVAVAYASAKYIFRVLRIRAGVVSELVEDTTVTYDVDTWRYSAGTVIVQTCTNGDILKIYYESATAYTTLWTDNDVDEDFLLASYCEVYIKVGTGTRVYRLQSVGIDVAFERADYKEIGNDEVVLTGTKTKTVTVSLDRFAENNTLEDILAGDATFPYINPRDFVDTIQIMVKIYKEKEHTNFLIGYLMTGLSPTTLGITQAVEDYQKKTNALEGQNLLISDDEAEVVFA